MALPSDLLSQFVKITNNKPEAKRETITWGDAYYSNEQIYVRIDGSNTTIPADSTIEINAGSSTTNEDGKVEINNGTRVLVMIKDHRATILGAVGDHAAVNLTTKNDLKVSLEDVKTLKADNVKINNTLTSYKGTFEKLEADNLKVNEQITAMAVDVTYLKTNILTAEDIRSEFATIEKLNATNAEVFNLKSTYGDFVVTTTERLDAAEATIGELDVTYANIDFTNIGNAAMEYLYSKSGLIDNVVVGDGTITGHLVGVTIKGDLIEANTLVADKLVIQGEDGLYYKLNTDGVTVDGEQTEYNSLNGSIITAKSITATQISVDDLVAFDATIGGFTISDDSIYSYVKDSEDNVTRGVYLGADGQANFGDGDHFIKYYRDENGDWRLAISADTILYDIDGTPHSIADLGVIGEYVKIGTYEDEPCIELGETDSDFKLLITNTRMLFMEGADIVAHVSNQSLHIKRAVIEEELQQGEFVWKVRANGNMGLMWKGDA